ncbi:RagB/SusD family nutrient uptake outer membrane protein [Sphingobacterium sp. UT-1RO-CII-1]|uniref:RagB/SusD family nutrient uptake outer membrane protein n=1 Tax=Sphingobacterium sp. UT-1RO-CII-1 TaxID=2995225 RepID=UPI00227BD4E8|nr:RagB/SusD family nutrient uptake outer membrane protein [Sphingobacterium sp. UT-1RO-CII-1]MCY4780011.1 RagB/SusD family nutrient uptake outer membrane protein [Sphingobacterium sp. UT-1RO-CII-1]
MLTRYILIGLSALFLFGCIDALDKTDLSAVTERDVWNDPLYASAYLNKLYNDNLPDWNASIAGDSDEAGGGDAIMYGQLTSTSIDTWNYTQIRNINLFIENVSTGLIDKATQEELSAQALILRAWRYFQMVRQYGGIPMLMSVQGLNDDLYVSRNKTSESIALIVKDLDDALVALPWSWSGNDEGRFTKATALALKGRVLLYYASPQFNPNNELKRWEEAFVANETAFHEISANGHALHPSYENIWFDEMNKEVLFVKRYQEPSVTHTWDAATRPLSEAQNYSGANQPTLEMVNSYPMIDGETIEESADYDAQFYWKNRDPRFAATIAHNGVLWELSGKKGRKQWTYAGHSTQNPTTSGFYCRKAINLDYTPYLTERSSTDWIELRFAEVMLNYAEAAAEVGKLEVAYEMLKKIRERAGILAGNDVMYGLKIGVGKTEMIKMIMLERKIEFAYEGKRYWDLRRRKLFTTELNGTKRHALMPRLLVSQAEFDKVKDGLDINTDYFKYFVDEKIALDQKFDINFRENYYFYAIPNQHIESNSKLEQTQGWDNGTFNPYD